MTATRPAAAKLHEEDTVPRAARVANARAAAQSYAPTPNGSIITYGLIAAALVLVAAIIGSAFYGVDALTSMWPIGLLALAAFSAGATLQVWRRNTHDRAFRAEYDARSPIPAPLGNEQPPDHRPTVDRIGSASMPAVTFRYAFLLPGLDSPHASGTFEILQRREALDVSFDASIVTLTILLTGGGRTEALDVNADDLVAALELDRRGSS